MKKMSRCMVVSLVVIFIVSSLVGCSKSGGKDGGELNLIVWSEYLPDEVVSDFEQETGVKVNITTYTSADEMLAKVQSSAAGTYDMIIAPGVNTAILIKENRLDKLDISKIKNYGNVDPAYMSTPNDKDNEYSIPYLYTSVVIAVNTDVIKDEITSYQDLLKPEYKDKMVVVEDARTMITAALIATGNDVNDTSDEALQAAKDYLMKLKPNIHAFNGDSPKTLLLNGECPLGLIYGGECALAMDENPAIKGIYPKEGIYFEMDMMMKAKGAKNPENVEKFIDYILDGKVSAKVSEAFPYINPNMEAKKYLSEDYLSNTIKNIPQEEVKKGKQLVDIGDGMQKVVDIWDEFKAN